MILNTPAITYLREDRDGLAMPLPCLRDACVPEQEREALNELFNCAHEGSDFFCVGTFDAWFSISDAGAERTIIRLLSARDKAVLGEFAVDQEWARTALAAGYVILADPPAEAQQPSMAGREPEPLFTIQGISLACVAEGEIPQ
jgi:hypothetical protein